ncbi:MAG: ChrR family anti-sigma-E factor [Alphaproteobacteria bacterium]|nr:ChrR family anti-sigma-E factor [Alphaproteobacteria bacterium]
MTIVHHPSEETLIAFVNGSLCEGNSLVVATHIAHCGKCQQAIRDLGMIAGGLLEQAEPAPIGKEARTACLSKLDDLPVEDVNAGTQPLRIPAADRAMAPLSLYDSGKWHWVGVGVQQMVVDVPSDTGTRVFVLKAAPGTRLPDHRHVGTEWTCVLKGAFVHDHGRFGAGDFDEADASVDHNPFVEKGEECICLVAMNGHVEMTGWLGRLIQPLVRF